MPWPLGCFPAGVPWSLPCKVRSLGRALEVKETIPQGRKRVASLELLQLQVKGWGRARGWAHRVCTVSGGPAGWWERGQHPRKKSRNRGLARGLLPTQDQPVHPQLCLSCASLALGLVPRLSLLRRTCCPSPGDKCGLARSWPVGGARETSTGAVRL